MVFIIVGIWEGSGCGDLLFWLASVALYVRWKAFEKLKCKVCCCFLVCEIGS